MKPNTIEDVLARLDRSGGPDACWPWTGALTRKGYGQVRWRGRRSRVHRVIAEHFIGSVRGWIVRHTCDNPPCGNPAHLRLGTHADNTRDMLVRGRGRYQKVGS